MAVKPNKNQDPGSSRKSQEVLIPGLRKLSPGRKGKTGLDPMLIPEKIRLPETNPKTVTTYDILDMKSKKIIAHIGENISDLASINPLEEGGFGLDHPGVKTRMKGKKNAKSFLQTETNAAVKDYSAVLQDLMSVMEKLAENRKQVFSELSKKS